MNPIAQPLRGHRQPGFNRCLGCGQKIEKHKESQNVGEGLVHARSRCYRVWKKRQRREER